MGVCGGGIGCLYNHIHGVMIKFRAKRITKTSTKMFEVVIVTFLFCCVGFVLPLLWNQCTPIPIETATWTGYENSLLSKLVRFECDANYYNQVASLYFTSSDTTLQQLVN